MAAKKLVKKKSARKPAAKKAAPKKSPPKKSLPKKSIPKKSILKKSMPKRAAKPASAAAPVLPLRQAKQVGTSRFRCPDCRCALNDYAVYGITIEACPNCQGLWLHKK